MTYVNVLLCKGQYKGGEGVKGHKENWGKQSRRQVETEAWGVGGPQPCSERSPEQGVLGFLLSELENIWLQTPGLPAWVSVRGSPQREPSRPGPRPGPAWMAAERDGHCGGALRQLGPARAPCCCACAERPRLSGHNRLSNSDLFFNLNDAISHHTH